MSERHQLSSSREGGSTYTQRECIKHRMLTKHSRHAGQQASVSTVCNTPSLLMRMPFHHALNLAKKGVSVYPWCVCVLWFAPHHSESKELAAAATHPLAAKACRRGHNFTTRCNPNVISAVLQPYWQACGCGQGKAA